MLSKCLASYLNIILNRQGANKKRNIWKCYLICQGKFHSKFFSFCCVFLFFLFFVFPQRTHFVQILHPSPPHCCSSTLATVLKTFLRLLKLIWMHFRNEDEFGDCVFFQFAAHFLENCLAKVSVGFPASASVSASVWFCLAGKREDNSSLKSNNSFK